MNNCTNNPAARRYFRRFGITMLLYAVLLCVSVVAFTRFHPEGALAYLLAVLPAIPVMGIMAVFGLYLKEEKDELQRAIGVQALLWGTGGTLTVTTVWGFLENFVHVPRLELMWVYPIFWVFFGLSLPMIHARYR